MMRLGYRNVGHFPEVVFSPLSIQYPESDFFRTKEYSKVDFMFGLQYEVSRLGLRNFRCGLLVSACLHQFKYHSPPLSSACSSHYQSFFGGGFSFCCVLLRCYCLPVLDHRLSTIDSIAASPALSRDEDITG